MSFLSEIDPRPRFIPFALLVCGVFAACTNTTGEPEPEPAAEPEPDPGLTIVVDGIGSMDVPEENPYSDAKAALGRKLFYDERLSGDETLSCGGCHKQEHAFGDDVRFSEGIHGDVGGRTAPTLVNIGFAPLLFWDGRADSLEAQARGPIEAENEMAADFDVVIERLENDGEYPELFANAFSSTEITEERVLQAIATFERTLNSNDSKFDKWQRGETTLNEQESLGYELFFTERADCFHCHGAPLFTDHTFHDIGLEIAPIDLGLGGVSLREFDLGKFKTPTLRNVAVSAPYMHDGRFTTLTEVIGHYQTGVKQSLNIDPLINKDGAAPLTVDEVAAVIAFLHTLTDDTYLENQGFSDAD